MLLHSLYYEGEICHLGRLRTIVRSEYLIRQGEMGGRFFVTVHGAMQGRMSRFVATAT